MRFIRPTKKDNNPVINQKENIATDTSGYTVSNVTASGATISNAWMTSLVSGMTVYMRGGTTGATLTGEILGVNYIIAGGEFNTYLTDQVRIEYTNVTRGGDSGGIVYTYHNGHNAVVGIHQGCRYKTTNSNYSDPTKNWGIATKAHNVYNVMGIVPY